MGFNVENSRSAAIILIEHIEWVIPTLSCICVQHETAVFFIYFNLTAKKATVFIVAAYYCSVPFETLRASKKACAPSARFRLPISVVWVLSPILKF